MSSELLLYVYDYNYSSWSMRAGLALRQTGAEFRELNAHEEAEGYDAVKARSPNGRFPLLKHGTEWVWDSLAISEYLAELFPHAGLWPASDTARAHARAMVAEMHSSFGALREACPMNLRAHYPGFLKALAVQRDVTRISYMWQACLQRYGGNGPFLFGSFTLADAFFAPVVMRFTTYDVELPPPLKAYAEAVRAQPYVKDWLARAALDRHVNPAYDFSR
jgi:glutathione S-transferase